MSRASLRRSRALDRRVVVGVGSGSGGSLPLPYRAPAAFRAAAINISAIEFEENNGAYSSAINQNLSAERGREKESASYVDIKRAR